MIWIAAAAALLAGLGAGWLLRVGRSDDGHLADWKTRLAARDRDLAEAQHQLADVTVELQAALARLDRISREADDETGLPADVERLIAEERERADSLAERLEAAEAELSAIGDPDGEQALSGDPALIERIEQLEVELATVASLRCPNPGAHQVHTRTVGEDAPAAEDPASAENEQGVGDSPNAPGEPRTISPR